MRTHGWWLGCVVVVAVVAVGCGGGSAAKVGPAGGTVTGPEGAQVVIPAGALDREVEVGVARAGAGAPTFPPPGFTAAGVAYAFTPHGTTFAVPVTVRVPFDPGLVPSGATPRLLRAPEGGAYAAVAGASVDGGFLTASVSTFSFYAPGTPGGTEARYSQLASSCAREALSGNVWCWGDQGNIAYLSSYAHPVRQSILPEPTQLPTKGFGEVVGGFGSVCGINGAEVWCIGSDQVTGPADAGTAGRTHWVEIPLPTGVVLHKLAHGSDFACGIGAPNSPDADARGRVYCWGENARGQLGRGNTDAVGKTVAPVIAPASGDTRYVALAAGGGHACAARQLDGEVFCWGSNIEGEVAATQLGSFNFTATPLARGLQVDPRQGALLGLCGLKVGGAAWCWGDNFYGQMGNGTAGTGVSGQNLRPPSEVPGYTFKALSVGPTMCGITTSDETYCWGYGASGSLGNGQAVANPGHPTDEGKQKTPVKVSVPSGVTFAELSNLASAKCARTTDNAVYCWGSNTSFQLGLGESQPAFAAVPTPIKPADPARVLP